MIDHSKRGQRVRTLHLVDSPFGRIPRGSLGTVLYGTENGVGRPILDVNWDCLDGAPRQQMVFPGDVEEIQPE